MTNSESRSIQEIVNDAFQKDRIRQAKEADEIKATVSQPHTDSFLEMLREAMQNDD